jgi:dienelactone hydrolase
MITTAVHEIQIPVDRASIDGDLVLPPGARGLVLFAHGSGSSRKSSRNRYVAERLHHASLATLLMDLLTPSEERIDLVDARLRFDIPFLAERLRATAAWVAKQKDLASLPVGYFGASTGAAAALVAAAEPRSRVRAIVSRGGRPDLASSALPLVQSPTLLIVGGDDRQVLQLNRQAFDALRCEKRLAVVPGATHLFEEPGALKEVAHLAAGWFCGHLDSAGWAPTESELSASIRGE